MNISRLDRENARIFHKLTKTDQKNRILVFHPRFRNFLSAITDVTRFQNIFDGIQSFSDDFEIKSTICHTFLVPPSIPVLKHIKHCRDECGAKNIKPHVEIWFQPRINEYVKAFMVENHLAPSSIVNTFPSEENPASANGAQANENISVFDLGIDLIALDKDVISMGNPFAFLRAFSKGDLTIVSDFRRALDSLAKHSGGFLSIHALGTLSSAISRTLPPPNADHRTRLILLDRTADLLTPAITQMGYEGLIAEFFGIDYGTVEVPAAKSASQTSSENSDTQLQLLSSKEDPLFATLCCLNQQEATQEIQQRTADVNSAFKPSSSDTSMEEGLAAFKAQSQKALDNKTLVDHLNIAQHLLERMKKDAYFRIIMNGEAQALSGEWGTFRSLLPSLLEEGAPLCETIRVACLEFLLRGSLQDYAGLSRQLIVNFGFQMYPYMRWLERAGLLGGGSGKKWSALIKPLQLFADDWEKRGDEAAANYQGYVPISVRIAEKIANGEFQAVKRIMEGFVDDFYCAEAPGMPPNPAEGGDYVVVFVGGCTHSELNCLRRISRAGKNKFEVLTSDLFSTKSFFANMGDEIPGFKTEVSI